MPPRLLGTLQVHDSTFTNPVMAGAVAVSHVADPDDIVAIATDHVQNWPILLSNNSIKPDSGPRSNTSECAELTSPSPNSSEIMQCGGVTYGCDPSCSVARFDCDRNSTGIPCKKRSAVSML